MKNKRESLMWVSGIPITYILVKYGFSGLFVLLMLVLGCAVCYFLYRAIQYGIIEPMQAMYKEYKKECQQTFDDLKNK